MNISDPERPAQGSQPSGGFEYPSDYPVYPDYPSAPGLPPPAGDLPLCMNNTSCIDSSVSTGTSWMRMRSMAR